MKKARLAKKFLDELSRVPIVSVVSEKTGISRQTVYRWINEDPKFAEQYDKSLDSGRDAVTDLAESKLISNINKGKQRPIEFWLTNNTKRYYKPKKPMPPPTIKQDYKFELITSTVDPDSARVIQELKKKYDLPELAEFDERGLRKRNEFQATDTVRSKSAKDTEPKVLE